MLAFAMFGIVAALGGGSEAYAEETKGGNKHQYHLFNPTPPDLMRELSPDRPDTTESPLTVDAGHIAFEVSLFDWRRDGSDDAFTVMATNFKIGLSNDIDFQTVFDLYSWEAPETGDGAKGFSDIQFRLKYNWWGNDEGNSALALFPYVKIPSGTELSNDEVEGGLIVPFSIGLSERIGLGLMAEFDAVYDAESDGHEFEFLHSAVLGFDLTDRIGLFTEAIGITGNRPYQMYLSGGFTCAIDEDLILDVGTQVGLNEPSEDLGLFFGFTKRY